MIRQSASSAGSATPLRLGARAEAVTVMSEAKRQKSDDPPYDGGDGDGDDDDGDDGDDDERKKSTKKSKCVSNDRSSHDD